METASLTKQVAERGRELRIVLASPVSGAANGGTAAYVRHLGNRLAGLNYQVSGICRVETATDRSLDYGYSESVGPRFLAGHEFEGWRTQRVGPKAFLRTGFRVLPWLITRRFVHRVAPAFMSFAYKDAVAAAIPAGTQVMHYTGTGWELFGFACRDAARAMGCAVTCTPFVHPRMWGDSRVDVIFCNSLDAVFVCSDFERKHLESLGVSPELLVKTPMAPPVSEEGSASRFRAKWSLGDRPLVLFLARREEYKGYHALRRGMARVLEAVPAACLVVAGPDGERPYPDLPDGSVLDLGELKPGSPGDMREKADALAACDIFCMPSRAEAFGLVYVEAWSYSKPVIGGPAPAVQELLQDGEGGFCVDQNPVEIAAGLIKLLLDPGLRIQLGAQGHSRQREQFSWEAVVQAHETVWRKVLANKKHRPHA